MQMKFYYPAIVLICLTLFTTSVYAQRIKYHRITAEIAPDNLEMLFKNLLIFKIKFFKKHYSQLEWMIVVLLSFYHVVFKIVILALLSPFNLIYWKKTKAYLYTLPRVFNPPQGMK